MKTLAVAIWLTSAFLWGWLAHRKYVERQTLNAYVAEVSAFLEKK